MKYIYGYQQGIQYMTLSNDSIVHDVKQRKPQNCL